MFIRTKGPYHYLVRSCRTNGKVRQEVIVYLGRCPTLKAAIDGTAAAVDRARGRLRMETVLARHRERLAYLRSVAQWCRTEKGPPPQPPDKPIGIGDRVLVFLDVNREPQSSRMIRRGTSLRDRQVERALTRLQQNGLVTSKQWGYSDGDLNCLAMASLYEMTPEGKAHAQQL